MTAKERPGTGQDDARGRGGDPERSAGGPGGNRGGSAGAAGGNRGSSAGAAGRDPERVRMSVLVSGHVQGVAYRAFVRKQALGLGISGYAENMTDGRVEVVAEGRRDDLEFLLVKMKVGPTHAEVEALEVEWAEAGGLSGFHVY